MREIERELVSLRNAYMNARKFGVLNKKKVQKDSWQKDEWGKVKKLNAELTLYTL